jgi:hypothetical protein
MTRGDELRRRRCRVLPLAMALGVLLPIFQPSWITFGAAVAGIAVLLFLYLRECRHEDGRESSQ